MEKLHQTQPLTAVSPSPLILWAGTGEVPDQIQWQAATGFSNWIEELDSGTHRLGLKAEQTEPFSDADLLRREILTLVMSQLYTEFYIHGIESLVCHFRVIYPVCSSLQVPPWTYCTPMQDTRLSSHLGLQRSKFKSEPFCPLMKGRFTRAQTSFFQSPSFLWVVRLQLNCPRKERKQSWETKIALLHPLHKPLPLPMHVCLLAGRTLHWGLYMKSSTI